MSLKKVFDEKYFEDGVRSRVSAYENYRWMPERTIREASSIINNIQFNTVLDYGCAKGFMVYAMRLLGKEAYGVDVSEYAVTHGHEKVKEYLSVIETTEDIKGGWDLIIAKDPENDYRFGNLHSRKPQVFFDSAAT
jgi:2-polyprenyl-3-methyl-5-hydroxy-6-metoxy-1,4-benzoquinol methylase